MGSSGNAADPGHQFLEGKRLHQIIVCAQIKAGHLIGERAKRGDQDNGGLDALMAEGSQDIRAFHAGQHSVKQDHVVNILLPKVQRFFPVQTGIHGEMLLFQLVSQCIVQMSVVFGE